MSITFRPHHFLCALGFQGKGYSKEFVNTFAEIVEALAEQDGDEIEISVVESVDDICAPCPKRNGMICQTQSKIDLLDAEHAKALAVKAGDRVSWGEAKKRMVESISLDKFEKICAPCSWKRLGVCRNALKKLHIDYANRGC